MKSEVSIQAGLSPLRGLFGWRGQPTAHAVGYSLTALRACSSTIAACFLSLGLTGCGNAKSNVAAAKPTDSSEITNGITTKTSEVDRDKDGRPDFRIEQFFRGNQKVMMVFSERGLRGEWIVTSRSYEVGGTLVAMEHDEDRDGIFETLVLYRDGHKDLEVFDRQTDGSVRPASTHAVEGHRRLSAAFSGFFEEMSDKGPTPKNLDEKTIEGRIRATQKRVQEALKEIHEGKQ